MRFTTEEAPNSASELVAGVTRTVRKLRAPLFTGRAYDQGDLSGVPQSFREFQDMNRDDLSDVVTNEEALLSVVSRLVDPALRRGRLRRSASVYHRLGDTPLPLAADTSVWTTDDHGLTYTAAFATQSRLFHYAAIPLIAVCGLNVFPPAARLSAAQALDGLSLREIRSAAEMAFFRHAPNRRSYQQSLTCPVVIVSLAFPRRWTLSVCDGDTAAHALFVDWIDARIASVSTAYREDGELSDVAAPALSLT